MTGDVLDIAVQLPNFRSLMVWHTAGMHDAIHSARVSMDYVSQEFGQLHLSEEVVLSLYSIYWIHASDYSTYLLIFKSQKGSTEAQNFRVITL